jgi:AcrR family transcriptional regulator
VTKARTETRSRSQPAPEAGERGDGRGRPTREAILAAALRILGRDGYRGLTARSIAAEAGTNLALVNYYFGSKQNLLLALFDEFDRTKLARQREMYADPALSLSQKWRQAVSFYREDLADGYVRMLQELVAVGYGNPAIAEQVRERMNGWRRLLEEVAAQHLPGLGIALPPRLVANAVVDFWLGMEALHLCGTGEDEGAFFETLDFVGDWLEAREVVPPAA